MTRRGKLLDDARREDARRAAAAARTVAPLDGPTRSRRPCATIAERDGLKLGKVAQPLRAALTGRSDIAGMFDVLAVLGREESLARIADQASVAESARPCSTAAMLHCDTFIGALMLGSAK